MSIIGYEKLKQSLLDLGSDDIDDWEMITHYSEGCDLLMGECKGTNCKYEECLHCICSVSIKKEFYIQLKSDNSIVCCIGSQCINNWEIDKNKKLKRICLLCDKLFTICKKQEFCKKCRKDNNITDENNNEFVENIKLNKCIECFKNIKGNFKKCYNCNRKNNKCCETCGKRNIKKISKYKNCFNCNEARKNKMKFDDYAFSDSD